MISELFPNVAKHADDLCLLNGMATDLPNHPQAAVQLHTGSFQFVRPSMGAWILYGLGTENQELPGFITINPITRVGGAVNFGSSFLPAPFQGTPIGGEGQSLANAVIPNIANRELTREQQRKQLDLLQSINRDRLKTNEMLLQNTVTRSLADDISQHAASLKMMQANLSSAIQIASGRDISAAHVRTPMGVDVRQHGEASSLFFHLRARCQLLQLVRAAASLGRQSW
jgi:hypothetical protein